MAKKKVAKKPAAKSRKGPATISMGAASANPDQQDLPGFERPKISAIEAKMKRLIAAKRERLVLNEEINDIGVKLTGLLEKNDLSSYECLDKQIFLEPGSPTLKIRSVKTPKS